MEEKNKKGFGILDRFLQSGNTKEFNAELAWIESTYGEGTFKQAKIRIEEKQYKIRNTIRSKFAPAPQNNQIKSFSYHCVVDIEEDLMAYTNEVFKPFIEGGFDVICLSSISDNIEDGVYMISWKNIFKKKNASNQEKKEEKPCDGNDNVK